eukprot:2314488-Pleurochrysis_carterae.AAC.1
MILGIIPEWKEASDKGKRGTIEIMKSRTGDMMNWARIQMKKWMVKKNEQRAHVQRRWDNRIIMKEVFQKWKLLIQPEHMDKDRGQAHNEEEGKCVFLFLVFIFWAQKHPSLPPPSTKPGGYYSS